MNYFTNFKYKSVVYFTSQLPETINLPTHLLINLICNKYLIDYKSYRRLVFRETNIYRQTPVYLSEELILFPTGPISSYETSWINYSNIKKVIFKNNNICRIIFTNNESLITKMSKKYYNNKVDEITQIRRYLNSLVIVNIFK